MNNFLGLSKQEASPASASWSVLPVPYERTTTYVRGCRRGPTAIIAASSQVELYDERLREESYKRLGIYTAPAVRCQGVEGSRALQRIETAVK